MSVLEMLQPLVLKGEQRRPDTVSEEKELSKKEKEASSRGFFSESVPAVKSN